MLRRQWSQEPILELGQLPPPGHRGFPNPWEARTTPSLSQHASVPRSQESQSFPVTKLPVISADGPSKTHSTCQLLAIIVGCWPSLLGVTSSNFQILPDGTPQNHHQWTPTARALRQRAKPSIRNSSPTTQRIQGNWKV